MRKDHHLPRLPARVALLYAFVAALWILFSDSAIVVMGLDPESHTLIGMGKGLVFVAVTAVLLFFGVRRGVAGQLHAFKAMEHAERRQRQRVEALPQALLEVDAGGVIRFGNPEAERLFEVAGPSLPGVEFGELLRGLGAHQQLSSALERVRSGGDGAGSFRGQLAAETPEPVELRVDWSVDPYGPAGRQLVVVVTDITDWVRASAESQRLVTVLESTTDLVATCTPRGNITYLNRAGRSLLGVERDAVVDALEATQFMPFWARRLARDHAVPEALRCGSWSGETALMTSDGRELPVSQVIVAHRDDLGRVQYLSTIARDISERKAMDEALYASREQYRSLVENTHDGLVVSQRGRVRYVNPQLANLLGFSPAEYTSGSSMTFVHPEDRDRVREWYRAIQRGESVEQGLRFRFLTITGGVCWVEGKASTIVWEGADATLSFFTDITEQVEAEGRLEYLAEYDALTGLPNRDLFLSRLDEAITHSEAQDGAIGVVYLNLTRFQIFNDSYGHELGDRLLRAVAERLADAVDDGDVVSRVGGDEFAVILDGLPDADAIPPRVRALLGSMAEPFRLQGHEFYVSASAGIAVYPEDGARPEVLLRNAASALEAVKKSGAGGYHYYAAGLNENARRRLALETDLRHALGRGEFELHFQPQADMQTGRLTGAEALLRWNHSERGLVMPGDFIPLLEESELILDVGAWVLEQACLTQRRWWREYGQDLVVSVNLSARQLDDPLLVDRVRAILDRTDVDPHRVELEITESSLVHNPEEAAATLEALKRLGLSLAVDDFGTGYSSLSYFRRFPVDTLKIDKAFVSELTRDPDTAGIVRAIIAMAGSLHCHIVAEGVETLGQLRMLRQYGCHWMQGYFLSRPLSVDTFDDLVRDGHRFPVAGDGDSAMAGLLVVGGDQALLRQLDAVTPAHGRALSVDRVTTTGEAFEWLATRETAAVLVDQSACEDDMTSFATRVQALYPQVRRLLMGGVGDVLVRAHHFGQQQPFQRFVDRGASESTLEQMVLEAVAAYDQARDTGAAGTGDRRAEGRRRQAGSRGA
ncbi:sensor domain-containing protein [Aquisalimonas asiatica]|uniref:cyclic-guanylate-specific phosphodiesterase n=1 Tax=Aquisalimonas asiatica TaxID=406100 RepID=A0A1H8QQM9_9GAMM|nr:bifunctional diguanylate cyclase/phosphodiesterase [Aquisalimonas asiatica]SEO56281.1 PAS domain S-box-containing protein/diguanylate cyclase (GGDEF) domain-containing protein [Aquisalimonas asiatica]